MNGLLISGCLLMTAITLPYKALAGPYVPQGPFVGPFPSDEVPLPTEVPGKEYSNHFDREGFPNHILDPEQNIAWDGAGGTANTFDYSFTRPGDTLDREVDALANSGDALFFNVIENEVALLLSTGIPGGPPAIDSLLDDHILYEDIFGANNVWAAPPQIDREDSAGQQLPEDVDGLEVWGPEPLGPVSDATQTDDANRYSLMGDPATFDAAGGFLPKTSVWHFDGVNLSNPYIFASEIAGVLDLPDFVEDIDLDAMMTFDTTGPRNEFNDGDWIMFSLAPIDLDGDREITNNAMDIDGGEIWVWQKGGGINFLNHGGHLWDTAFDVMNTFGTGAENVNALEAVSKGDCPIDPDNPQVCSVPEPSSTLGLLVLGTLGAASTLKRQLKPSKSPEKETEKVS